MVNMLLAKITMLLTNVHIIAKFCDTWELKIDCKIERIISKKQLKSVLCLNNDKLHPPSCYPAAVTSPR